MASSSGAYALAGDAPRVAFYALRPGGWRDYLTLLHLPYTAWHLSYVAIGASLASEADGGRLVWTLAAFFLAVGVAAHCLDELNGRPLGTAIPASVLVGAATLGLAGAAVIGVSGVPVVGASLLVFVGAGIVLVVGYNLELLDGALHTDRTFAAAWGGFPVLVGGFAQAGVVTAPVLLAAAFGTATSLAQRHLSNWARGLRRGALRVDGVIERSNRERQRLTIEILTDPAERALMALAAAHVALALALVALRFQ